MDTNTNLDSGADEQAYQESFRNLLTALNNAGTKAESLLSVVEEFTQQATTKLGGKAAQRPPKGFIEVTLPTENAEKMLVAVRTIGSIRVVQGQQPPRASISFHTSPVFSKQEDELEVRESYDDLKRRLAAAY